MVESGWSIVIDFSLLSLFLGIATYLKRSVSLFQKFLIPTSIIGGFIGLIAGPGVLGLFDLDINRLGNMVYHLMAIGFIALALKERNHHKNKDIVNTGIFIVSTYLVQGILGFLITLILSHTIYPNLFPPFGLLLPLGYGQGPGQAYSIGLQWESVGFTDGANIGLTIATFGFLWACIGGVPLLNFLIRKRKMTPIKETSSENLKKIYEEDNSGEIPLSESIDIISIQLFLIGIVYLATYVSLKLLSNMLTPLGTFGLTLSKMLWGFHFIIGTIYAIFMRLGFDYFKKKKIIVRNYPNNYLLQRISGGCFDFMITASIAAISITTFREFLVPILLITTLGGFLTVFYCTYMCKKIYENYKLENIVGLYGMMTGTISTGLALLREADPNFESNTAENLVLGSAAGLVLGLPVMMILNIPVFGFVTNQPIMYIYTIAAIILYLLILYYMLYRNCKVK